MLELSNFSVHIPKVYVREGYNRIRIKLYNMEMNDRRINYVTVAPIKGVTTDCQ